MPSSAEMPYVQDLVTEKLMRDRLAAVRLAIDEAAHRVGRNPQAITLIGVSKFFPVDAAITAVKLGLTDLGENRVQEMLGKQDTMALLGLTPNWHLIGTLQKNKVKYIIGRTHLIHSVDSFELLTEINNRSLQAGLTTDILLQVNTAQEASKHGLTHADVRLWVKANQHDLHSGLRIRGLMTMAPLFDDPEATRPVFAQTQQLYNELRDTKLLGDSFDVLSMGMSHDYVQAIACGATHIRIGTAIFGARNS
ncbi:MAG: YggS family pyridoxal phosphate-dependent enzyme [Eubacteriales bacterium]|nr:YggS family pyridoxal phosphate-dependent enzyme [Eubacteriales bacterium]